MAALGAPNVALAGEPGVREIQRVLWSLDYGATRLDGIMSNDTASRLHKFLADRGKSELTDNPQIISELRAAADAQRIKATSSNDEVVDRSRLLSSNSSHQRMSVSTTNDVVFAGSCPINRVRVSDSAPLKPFRYCGFSFVVSDKSHLIVSNARWQNEIYGLLLVDQTSGLRIDFIEVPNADAFSTIAISPDGKDVLVLTTKADLWKVNLETRAVAAIAHLPNLVTQGIRFSPDGRFYSASFSIVSGDRKRFQNQVAVWDRANDRKLFDVAARTSVFSEDGSLIAIQDDKNSSQVDIREVATSRVIAKKVFSGISPDFSEDDGRVSFNRNNTGLLFVEYQGKILHQWDFKSGEIVDLVKFSSSTDRATIQPTLAKVITIEGANVQSYNLDGQAEARQSHVTSLEVKGGAVSSDQKSLIAFSNDSIAIVNLESCTVQSVPGVGVSNITSATFLPNSRTVVVGTEDGSIFTIENGARRTVLKLDAAIDVLVTARSGSLVAAQSGKKVIVLDILTGRTVAQSRSSNFQASSNNLAFVDNDSRLLFLDSESHRIIAIDIASGRPVLDQQMKSQIRRNGNQTNWMWAWIGFIAPNTTNPGSFWVGANSFGSNILYEYSNGRLSARKGTPEGTINFFPASSKVGDSFDDGALVVTLGNVPKVSNIDADKFASEHSPLRDEAVLVRSLSGGRFVTLDKSGEVRVYSRSLAAPLVRTILYGGQDWLSRTDRGFFVGTKTAAENLFLAQGASGSVSLDSLFNALYRPDLVVEAALGDPNGKVKSAAAQLDLDKVMASGMAPKVTIVSPLPGSASATDEVTVEASAADQGGGIGKVEWRVNGVTLGLESRGFDRLDASSGGTAGSGKSRTIRRTLALEPGDNRVEILAYNAQELIASEPAQVSIKWDGAKTAVPPRLYVLAIGVNDYYDSRLHLAYAVPDATALAEGFRKAGDGLYASVEVKTVLDGEVTLANLDKVFADLSRQVRPRDVFVFFLAGHGKTKNGRYYFLPRDFRYEDESSIEKAGMGQDKFQAWFAEIPARKSLLLYDTCESGSLTGATRGSDIDERLGALNRMARATGRTFLTATTDDAPALEGYHGHGVFTYAVLDALEHADVNKNGLIEISELADYIDQKVPDYSFEAFKLRQIPQRSIVGNNFALTNKMEVLPPSSIAAGSSKVVVGSANPTHVVIAPVDVFAEANGKGPPNAKLPAGALLTVIKTEQAWILVAKDGKQLGYVAADRLAQIQ